MRKSSPYRVQEYFEVLANVSTPHPTPPPSSNPDNLAKAHHWLKESLIRQSQSMKETNSWLSLEVMVWV
jgi:hypothetical protein